MHVDLDRGFGEGEVVGSEAGRPADAEETPHEGLHRIPQVGHSDVGVDAETFDLE